MAIYSEFSQLDSGGGGGDWGGFTGWDSGGGGGGFGGGGYDSYDGDYGFTDLLSGLDSGDFGGDTGTYDPTAPADGFNDSYDSYAFDAEQQGASDPILNPTPTASTPEAPAPAPAPAPEPTPTSELEAIKQASELGFDVGSQALSQAAESVTAGKEPSLAELKALKEAGFGTLEGVNPNNPTQSVQEMIAAQDVGSFLGKALPSVFSAIVPGFGMATSLAQTAQKVASGEMSIPQALAGTAAAYIARELGIPVTSVQAALAGDFGKATETALIGIAAGKIAEATGLPATAITSAMSGDLDKAATNLVWGKVAQGIAGATDLPSSLISAGLSTTGLKEDIGSFFRDITSADTSASSGTTGDMFADLSGAGLVYDGSGYGGYGGFDVGTGAFDAGAGIGAGVGDNQTVVGGVPGAAETTSPTATAPVQSKSNVAAGLLPLLFMAGQQAPTPAADPYQLADIRAQTPFGTVFDAYGGQQQQSGMRGLPGIIGRG